jgi:hypothetical protein
LSATLLFHAVFSTALWSFSPQPIDLKPSVHDPQGTLSVQVKEAIELGLYFPFLALSVES